MNELCTSVNELCTDEDADDPPDALLDALRGDPYGAMAMALARMPGLAAAVRKTWPVGRWQ